MSSLEYFSQYCTSVLGFIGYGEKISIAQLKGFAMPTVLNSYVQECRLTGFQTKGNLYKDIW